MSCIPCTKVSQSEHDVIKYYKKVFEKTGKVFYVYRLSSNSGFNVVEKLYFETIFNTQIKPNFDNGAEYFTIQEFTGN